MVDQTNPMGPRGGSGFKPGAILAALAVSVALLALYALVSRVLF